MFWKCQTICMLKTFSRFRKSKYKFIATIVLFIATFFVFLFYIELVVVLNISSLGVKQRTSKNRNSIPKSTSSAKDSRNVPEAGERGM